ncbi:hypothetical protein AVEN_50914-1 [Araneus ventricosus]|uniref:Uncharacterized protein n=1 Tax=Araneus ventricosus TaxID=182803 RepID=A0A4Y2DZW6_ARAVE|nr:hypothetical protein AVEN_50914-1 [Araneus ventricosus]
MSVRFPKYRFEGNFPFLVSEGKYSSTDISPLRQWQCSVNLKQPDFLNLGPFGIRLHNPGPWSNLRRRMGHREEKDQEVYVQEDFADFEANQHLMREIPDPYWPGSFFVFNVQEGRWERQTLV